MLRPSSKYAREGTAAHTVAEMTLNGDIFLPDKITVEGDEYIVSPGMCRALNPYISHVQNLMALPKATVVLEKRLTVPHTGGMVWGTLDCGVHTYGAMHVVDLKYGKGVAVAPDAPQLKLYALALAGLPTRPSRYRCHSHDLWPRVEGDRSFVRNNIGGPLGLARQHRATRVINPHRDTSACRPALPLVRPQD
jgi:hypothetical protein